MGVAAVTGRGTGDRTCDPDGCGGTGIGLGDPLNMGTEQYAAKSRPSPQGAVGRGSGRRSSLGWTWSRTLVCGNSLEYICWCAHARVSHPWGHRGSGGDELVGSRDGGLACIIGSLGEFVASLVCGARKPGMLGPGTVERCGGAVVAGCGGWARRRSSICTSDL